MRQLYHLMRIDYPTAEGADHISSTASMDSTWEIVDVDWSTPGCVVVTYRIPGP